MARVDISWDRACSNDADGFLRLHRLTATNVYADGSRSAEYGYDGVLRDFLDAVALVLFAEADGRTAVCLRSCLRPPLVLRREAGLPTPEEAGRGILWELPAGLLEPGADDGEAVRRHAALEALEETGYRLEPGAFQILGNAPFVSPGVIPERVHFACAKVPDVDLREAPQGDGSLAEDGPAIWWLPLDEALALCERDLVSDLKTELGLRRFALARPFPEKDAP